MNLFKKAAVCTDIHFGAKSNSVQHNQDCLDFIDWFVERAKQEGCETCIFLGDYSHHRASINMQTLQFALRGLEKFNDNFEQVFLIPGNHDLYYRDRRDIHSFEWARHLSNVTIVNDWFIKDDVVIAPWLVGEDYKDLAEMSGKYLFGHFELPTFYMNMQIAMPDHGELNTEHVSGFERVFSGHFHKRQAKKNVWYIGNAFPHNYSDAGDDARGMMVLEWDEEPQFFSWPKQPIYRVYKLSEVLDNPDGLLLPGAHVRVHLDIDISYEESAFIREELVPKYKLREMSLIPIKQSAYTNETEEGAEIVFESAEKIILEEIQNINSKSYDTKLLTEIYKSL